MGVVFHLKKNLTHLVFNFPRLTCLVQKTFYCAFFPVSKLSYSFAVMPENSNFPYRRYDRLPPIHQFSIESDTDLSETAELIEEYEVFDPTRPRPKIILVIGMRTESEILILLLTLFTYLHFKNCVNYISYLQRRSWIKTNNRNESSRESRWKYF